MEVIEYKSSDGRYRWEHPDLAKPRELTPPEKLALERHDALLTQKAESRQESCWTFNCEHKAVSWVREVCFDFKGDKAAPVRHAAISSNDYEGPIPGFCIACQHNGPPQLAQAVYSSRPEIAWGAEPTRWWVVFTDGTKMGGPTSKLEPTASTTQVITEIFPET